MINVVWVGEEPPEDLQSDEEFDIISLSSIDDVINFSKENKDCVIVLSGGEREEASQLFSLVKEEAPDVPCILSAREPPETTEGDVVFDYVSSGDDGKSLTDVIRSAVERRSHTSYPVPDNEDERLVAVEEYTGLGVSGEFDRLTKIAQEHFGADMAFVGIIEDNYENFLSCHGANVEKVPREETVCTYQILEDRVLVVENVLKDPRFEGRETLQEMGLRFYAGAPLLSPSGAKIGSFCIMHGETRSFSEDDKGFLRLLADEAMDKLELLRRSK